MSTHAAIVTGGSRGIGRAVAERVARAGAVVLVAARDEAGCEEAAASIRASGGEALALPLDVADPASVERAVARAREILPEGRRLDWLVHGAGVAEPAPRLRPDGDAGEGGGLYERHFAVNFDGPRRLTELLLGDLVAQGYGRVVSIASSAGLRGYAYVVAYCASKHALVGWTRALSLELEGTGVTLSAVCPHYVDSPMLEASIARVVERTGRSEADVRAFFRAENPAGELVTTEEVADAVALLLASEQNGAIVEMDGGPSWRDAFG